MFPSSLLLALLVSALVAGQSDLEVDAPAGPIVGHYAKGGTVTSVREFLGIPFAKPPVGSLRFAPPQKADVWAEPYEAAEFGTSCYNSISSLGGGADSPIGAPANQAEDCLSINVWAPSASRVPDGGAAVLLWIYGGGFTLGSSNSAVYSGTNLVRDQEGMIVVSFNRLNIFGFPGATGLPAGTLNPGFMDVRAAVEWVRDNIAAFGGDPKRITIFGESAGGSATDAYLYYSEADPIIAGAIMESGQVTIATDNVLSSSTPGTTWNAMLADTDCPLTPPAASVECMRALPAETLRQLTTEHQFTPVTDDGTLFADWQARLNAGRFAKVPVIIGSNHQELGDSVLLAGTARRIFTCPAAKAALGHTKAVPTWQYRYFGDFPTGIGGGDAGGLLSGGPTHGSEITQVFGTYNQTAATPQQIASSKYIQGAWTAFAKNPAAGLKTYGGGTGWPTLSANTNSLVRLAYNNAATASFVRPSTYHSRC